MQERSAAHAARNGLDPKQATPGSWRDIYIALTHHALPAEARHSHRATASAILKAVRGQSAMYNKLAYAFQCGDIDAFTRDAAELLSDRHIT